MIKLRDSDKPRALSNPSYLFNKVKKLLDIISDTWQVGIDSLEMLLVDLANALHALVDALVVAVGARFRLLRGLDQENGVAHVDVGTTK